MLNLNLETARFFKNEDGTYTVYQPIGKNSILKLPRVVVEIKAEALVDDSVGDFWQWIHTEKKPSKISGIFNRIKSCFRTWRKKNFENM